jgi:hypothetical protein
LSSPPPAPLPPPRRQLFRGKHFRCPFIFG